MRKRSKMPRGASCAALGAVGCALQRWWQSRRARVDRDVVDGAMQDDFPEGVVGFSRPLKPRTLEPL